MLERNFDPCLDNVLSKNFKVKVGDKEHDLLDGFQFYITTRLATPA